MSEESRHDLTDAAWALLEPHLPDRTPQRGGRWADHRLIVDGIRWRTRTGSPWRDLPERYGNWHTVYGRHRRWSADGTWTRVADELRRDADRDPGARDGQGAWNVSVDSSVVRASADAAGARHEPPKDVPTELLEELAAAVPAGARTTAKTAKAVGRSGSPPTPGPAATSDPSPAARAQDQSPSPAPAGDVAGDTADGEGAGGGVAGDGGAGGQPRTARPAHSSGRPAAAGASAGAGAATR